jgi:hypothetical protein
MSKFNIERTQRYKKAHDELCRIFRRLDKVVTILEVLRADGFPVDHHLKKTMGELTKRVTDLAHVFPADIEQPNKPRAA